MQHEAGTVHASDDVEAVQLKYALEFQSSKN
jgi:hypothetical protein